MEILGFSGAWIWILEGYLGLSSLHVWGIWIMNKLSLSARGDLDYGWAQLPAVAAQDSLEELIQTERDSIGGWRIMQRNGFGKDRELEDIVYLLHKYLKYSYF